MSQTLIIAMSSLLIISIILGVGAYYYYEYYYKEEEVPVDEEEQLYVAPKTTTAATTAAPITKPPVPTPAPTTAAPYEIGQSLKCRLNDVGGGTQAIYRYEGNNTLRMYPDAKIAKEWDTDFLNSKNIDCQDLKMGTNMSTKLAVGVEPDQDYVGLKQKVDINYENIPSVCYSSAGGDCNNLRYEDCEAEMKSLAKYGDKGTAGDFVIRQTIDNKVTLVWYSGTQYLNDDAKIVLGDDGILRIMSKGTNYWRSSNSESTNGPFAAHLEKENGKCRISIYDNDNTNLWSSS